MRQTRLDTEECAAEVRGVQAVPLLFRRVVDAPEDLHGCIGVQCVHATPNGFEYEVTCVATEADRPRTFAWVVLDDSGDPRQPFVVVAVPDRSTSPGR